MQLSELRADEDAQSEVLGAILMVGVVVALVGLAGTALLSVDDRFGSDQPRAEFAFEFDPSSNQATCSNGTLTDDRAPRWGELTVTHDGGAAINGTQLAISSQASGSSAELARDCTVNRMVPGSTASVLVDSDDTIRVTWDAGEGGRTIVLEEWTAPDA